MINIILVMNFYKDFVLPTDLEVAWNIGLLLYHRKMYAVKPPKSLIS